MKGKIFKVAMGLMVSGLMLLSSGTVSGVTFDYPYYLYNRPPSPVSSYGLYGGLYGGLCGGLISSPKVEQLAATFPTPVGYGITSPSTNRAPKLAPKDEKNHLRKCVNISHRRLLYNTGDRDNKISKKALQILSLGCFFYFEGSKNFFVVSK